MEKIAWLVLGGTTFVAALFAYRSRRALYVARGALGLLMVGAGALVNLIYLVTGSDYANFADAAHFAFIRDTWRSVVAPHQGLFVTLLIVFEATVGLLILSGGRKTQVGLVGLIGMQLGLLVFGWVLTIWALVKRSAGAHPCPGKAARVAAGCPQTPRPRRSGCRARGRREPIACDARSTPLTWRLPAGRSKGTALT
jgi:hypothetical protein